jgi:hypothetical protein
MQQSIVEFSIAIFGASLTIGSLIAYLGKKAIDGIKETAVKGLEIQLKLKADKELETLKYELQLLNLKNQLVFSETHKKRIEVIDVLLDDLNKIKDATGIVKNIPVFNFEKNELTEEFKKLNLMLLDFTRHIDKWKMYLKQDTVNSLKVIWNSLGISLLNRLRLTNVVSKDEIKEIEQQIDNAIKVQIPDSIAKLEIEFREILGTNN